jgi:hypothetical protein
MGRCRHYDATIDLRYCRLFTVEEFAEKYYLQKNGCGFWCKDGMEADAYVLCTKQEDATHVSWYSNAGRTIGHYEEPARAWVLNRSRVSKNLRRNGQTRRGYKHAIFMIAHHKWNCPFI